MTRDEVIRKAREAGATIRQGHRQGIVVYEDGGNLSPMVIYRFADLIAAAVRERCAQACEDLGHERHGEGRDDSEAFDCADMIRALHDGEQE